MLCSIVSVDVICLNAIGLILGSLLWFWMLMLWFKALFSQMRALLIGRRHMFLTPALRLLVLKLKKKQLIKTTKYSHLGKHSLFQGLLHSDVFECCFTTFVS